MGDKAMRLQHMTKHEQTGPIRGDKAMRLQHVTKHKQTGPIRGATRTRSYIMVVNIRTTHV